MKLHHTRTHTRPSKRQQKGIALLTTLLTISMMVILTNEITQSFRNQVKRTQLQQDGNQAKWYVMSAESLAMFSLTETLKDDPKTINLSQPWAMEAAQFPMENGSISGKVTDASTCFNLNALVQTDADPSPKEKGIQKGFTTLLTLLGVANVDAERLTQSTRNWVSSMTFMDGANNYDYLTRPMPYYMGGTQMRDVSEWRMVEGVSPALAERVMPFLCTIPSDKISVNVNTLKSEQAELIVALYHNTVSLDQVIEAIGERPEKGWKSVGEFTAKLGQFTASEFDATKLLNITTDFFRVNATATYGDSTAKLTSLLSIGSSTSGSNSDESDTQNTGRSSEISVIKRQFGGDE